MTRWRVLFLTSAAALGALMLGLLGCETYDSGYSSTRTSVSVGYYSGDRWHDPYYYRRCCNYYYRPPAHRPPAARPPVARPPGARPPGARPGRPTTLPSRARGGGRRR